MTGPRRAGSALSWRAMCRVCHKRPEIPDERYGRCEPCAKAGRIAYRFRLASRPGGGIAVKAGELSPRALREKWRTQLQAYAATPASKGHLGLHEAEMIVAKEKLESIRVAPDLAAQAETVVTALRDAAERTETAW